MPHGLPTVKLKYLVTAQCFANVWRNIHIFLKKCSSMTFLFDVSRIALHANSKNVLYNTIGVQFNILRGTVAVNGGLRYLIPLI